MKFETREEFLTSAGLFEFSLLVVALVLGWIFSVEPTEFAKWDQYSVLWGTLAAVPLFIAFLAIEHLPIGSVQKTQETVIQALGRYLSQSSHLELILLSILAGVGEEVLFRGFLMVWVESIAGYEWGLIVSSIAFGLMHAVTWAYTIFASIAGAYFGWIFDYTGSRNLLAPIATHAFYDYLAFLVIVREARSRGLVPPEPPPSEEEENFEW